MRYQVVRNTISKLIIFVGALYLQAFIFNALLLPLEVTTSGTSGVVIILTKIIPLSSSILTTLLYGILLFCSVIFLDKKATISILAATILYPLFVSLTSNVTDWFLLDYSDKLCLIVVSAMLVGFLVGTIFKLGYNDGGLSVIYLILHKYFHISIGQSSMYTKGLIVLIGCFVLGIENLLYSILFLYVNSLVMDHTILGISNHKLFHIVTKEQKQVTDLIMTHLNRGVTLITRENHLLKQDQMILCSVPTREYTLLKQMIKEVDPKAFIVITDSYEAIGGS